MVAACLKVAAFAFLFNYFQSNAFLSPLSRNSRLSLHRTASTVTPIVTTAGSAGVECLIEYLSSDKGKPLVRKFVLRDEKLKKEYSDANAWSGGNFVVKGATCTGIVEQGLVFKVDCEVKGKQQTRDVTAPFPRPVRDETELKRVLVEMCVEAEMMKETGVLATLPFGENVEFPKDMRFNEVPHANWVRDYLYESATDAVRKAIKDPTVPNKVNLLSSCPLVILPTCPLAILLSCSLAFLLSYPPVLLPFCSLVPLLSYLLARVCLIIY